MGIKLTIRTKIYLLCAIYSLAGLATSALLVRSAATASERYSSLMEAQVKTADLTRQMQLAFKKQVQEWKDVLVRGSAPDDLAKYRDGFFAEERNVQRLAAELDPRVPSGELRAQLAEFRQTHETLGREYRAALENFVKGGGRDFHAANQALKGKDRSPTDLLDSLVAKINEVTAASLAAEAQAGKRDRTVVFTASTLTWIALLVVAFFMAQGIVGALYGMVISLHQVADRDLSCRVDDRRGDEIGSMGRALNETIEQFAAALRTIGGESRTLAASAVELAKISRQMSENAGEAETQVTAVSAGAEESSKGFQAVATASEEMTATIREIAKSSSEAVRVASQAVQAAETTNGTIGRLGESSAEIGQVIKVITAIAQQTNLLALNATIEAARAGEAGKGFAVVANEVKELAKKTAKATEDIGGKIQAIQSDTKAAVAAIAEISGIIGQIRDIQQTIASAVEEQSATTSEITRNVNEAAQSSSDIAANIGGVAQATRNTSQGAADTQTAADELARMGVELQKLVGQFKLDESEADGPAGSIARGGSQLRVMSRKAA